VTFVDAGPNALGTSTRSTVEAAIREAVLEPLRMATTAAEEGDAEEALARFAGQRVLCAHRRGQYGVQHWNRLIESWVHDGAPAQHDYVGRPLLATRNDQRQRIANGDTGIIVATPAGRRAAFVSGGGIRLLAPAQLDTVETAYAMTIHKSQGSEYATVVVILPPADSPLVGRELLYTAVTRSTKRLIVVGSVAAVVACVDAPARRVTGLAAALGPQRPTSVTAP
jgi:exodeoxyribonuclease V alpha subunit